MADERDFRAELRDGCCPENMGCGVQRNCVCALADDMADEITTLRARLAEAEKVIRPLAVAAESYEPPEDDDRLIAWASNFTIGHLRAARAFLAKQGEGKGDAPRWRHRKRGSTYIIVANAQVQTDTPLSDYAEVIVYKSETDGKVWVRPTAEFRERFDEIDEPRKEVMPAAVGLSPDLHATPPQPVEPPAGAIVDRWLQDPAVKEAVHRKPVPDYRAIAARLMEALEKHHDLWSRNEKLYRALDLFVDTHEALAAARAAGLGGE